MVGRPADPQTRLKLIAAATNIMLTQGVAAVRVESVCQMAGLSKGAYFHYFADKKALEAAVLQAWVERGMSLFRDGPFVSAAAPRDRLHGYIDLIGMAVEQMPVAGCMVGILTQDAAGSNAELRLGCRAAFDRWARELGKLLAAAAPKGFAKRQIAELAAHFIVIFEGALILARAHNDPTQVRKHLAVYKNLLDFVFCAQENRELQR